MPNVPFFLKEKPQGAVISEHRSEKEKSSMPTNYGLHAAASELISAVNSNSPEGVAQALQAAFDLMEANEGEEAPEGEE